MKRLNRLVLLPVFAVLFAADAGSVRDLSWLQGKCPGGGAVAWHQQPESDIRMLDIETGDIETIGTGGKPEFSPDGSKIAWVSGTTAKGRMRTGDATVHTIATGVSFNAGVHWIANDEVVVLKGGKWYRVTLGGEQSEVPELTELDNDLGFESDVGLCADGVWSVVDGGSWKTSDGGSGSSPGHCSRSLSPDGKSITGLEHGHNTCTLQSIRSGGHGGAISLTAGDCGSKGFDNHRWSSNDPRFIVAQWECGDKVGVWEVGTSDCVVFGSCSGETYGDMARADGGGEPWPQQGTPDPKMVESDNALSFSAVEGQSHPAAKELTVSTDAGTLEGVSVGDTPSWLAVSLSAASGREITVSNEVDITGLGPDTYTADIQVSSSNAGGITYAVTLTVTAYEAPPALELVSPNGGESFTIGETVTVAWRGNEDSLPQGVDILISTDGGKSAWSMISGSASIEPGSASWESFTWTIPETVINESTNRPMSLVSSECVLLIRDYDEGSGIQDYSDGMFTITTPPDPNRLHLKYNCGGSGTVSGWADPSPFVSGGTPFDFGAAMSIAGVDDPAPAEVYGTCRHRVKNEETGFSYVFTEVPDGSYTVRLHFADSYSGRAIDVRIEGIEMVSDLDISSEAGGTDRALVIEKAASVGGGDGMTVTIEDDRSSPGDVLINGIEIIGASLSTRAGAPRSRASLGPISVGRAPGSTLVITTSIASPHEIALRTLDGRAVTRFRTAGPAVLRLAPGMLGPGVYIVSAGSRGAVATRRVVIAR